MRVDFYDIITIENEDYEKTFRKIKKITKKVHDVGFQLLFSLETTTYKEVTKQIRKFDERTTESLQLLRLFYYFDKPGDAEKSGKEIVHLVKTSKKLIRDDPTDFKRFQENWNVYNDLLKDQIATNTLLTKKGAKVRKVLFSSIFLFLTFENVYDLDNFQQQYHNGEIEQEMQTTLITDRFLDFFKLRSAKVRITIDDDNFREYRSWFGKETMS